MPNNSLLVLLGITIYSFRTFQQRNRIFNKDLCGKLYICSVHVTILWISVYISSGYDINLSTEDMINQNFEVHNGKMKAKRI